MPLRTFELPGPRPLAPVIRSLRLRLLAGLSKVSALLHVLLDGPVNF
jgi:hypothetical protein